MRKLTLVILFSAALTSVRAQICNTILVDSKIDCFVNDSVNSTCSYSKTIKILNKQGEDHADFVAHLSKSNELKSFSGTVTDANGKVIKKFKKGDLVRSEYSENFKTDSYIMVLGYTPVNYPCTIKYEWTETSSEGSMGYPVFCPLNTYEMQVDHASYSISVPADMSLRNYCVNMNENVSSSTDAKGRKVYSLQLNNLKALNTAPFSPGLGDRIPKAFFAPESFVYFKTRGKLDSWKSLGEWHASLYTDRQKLPQNIAEHIHSLCDNLSSDKEKLEAIYKYFGSMTRYVSIQLGIGGMQPIPADQVCLTGWGDCKGLSNLMMSMLAEVGIKSNVAAISTNEEHQPRNFPSYYNFNHAILMVPMEKDTVWMECTNPRLPLGFVHDDIAGHDALVISPTNSQLVTLPQYADDKNRQMSHATVELQADGSAKIELEQTSTGSYYDGMNRLKDATQEELKEYLFNAVSLIGGNVESISYNEKTDAYQLPSTTISATVNTRSFANKTGRRLFIKTDPFHYSMSMLPQAENREADVERSFGYTDIDDVEIILPEGHQVESFPQPVKYETPYGKFSISYKVEGQKVKVHAEHLAYHGKYKASEYAAFRDFYNNVKTAYSQKLIVVEK